MYSAQLGRRSGGAHAGTENAVSDVKIEQKQKLSRQEAARFIATLAEGLRDDDGTVTIHLGSSTLALSVANQVDCELEVAVDGDEIELELELKWSTSGRRSVEAAQGEFEADDLGADEPDEEAPEDKSEEVGTQEDDSDEAPSVEDAASVEAKGGASDEEAPGSREAESVPAAVLDQSAKARRGRRKTAAATDQAAFNNVDTAAVRARAAANGVTVSPRGRIKEEVVEAYRAAGN